MAGDGGEMEKKEQDSGDEKNELNAADEAPENVDNVAWLSDLADKELGKNGRTIIEALVEKAKKGDAPSINQLMKLAKDKKLKYARIAPGGKTLAQMLAEEPEWPGPPDGSGADESKTEPVV